MADRCAPCLEKWKAIEDKNERIRRGGEVQFAITRVDGVPVCSEHADVEAIKARVRQEPDG